MAAAAAFEGERGQAELGQAVQGQSGHLPSTFLDMFFVVYSIVPKEKYPVADWLHKVPSDALPGVTASVSFTSKSSRMAKRCTYEKH